MTKSSIFSRALLLLLVLNIGSHLELAAQKPSETAGISFTGKVVDREGIGIDDASILIESKDQKRKLRSDRKGEFKVALPSGTYRLTIERNAFKKLVVTDFVIKGGSPVNHSFPMEIDCCIDVAFIKPANFSGALPIAPAPEPQPNISVKGFYANDRAARGRAVQAAIVLEIPSGYHVNANRPLGKYAIPTTLKIEGTGGVKIGPVSYPRAIVRKLKATNNESLAVYEGRAILRFNVTVPANYQGNELVLKAGLRFQSCNDEVCFPPKSQDVDMTIGVVGAADRVQRINGWIFGGR
jgi:Disulphide bond corrector protein DsbC/Carboxypeptidase regulatory-like domain